MKRPDSSGQTTQVDTGAGLLAAIPVCLGYWPSESVLVVMCQGPQVELTIRIDIDWFLASFESVARQLEVAQRQLPAARCYLLGYFSDKDLVEVSLTRLMELIWADVADVLITDNQRWWSLLCDDQCCPPSGRPFDRNVQEVTAQAVFDGVDVGLRREDLTAVVAGPAPSEGLEREFDLARERVELCGLADRLQLLEDATHPDDSPDAMLLAALLADDQVCAHVLETFAPHNAATRLAWLRAAVATCPPSFAVPAVGLLGIAAWLGGGGPILTAAAQRLEQLDPDHLLARLLRQLVEGVVPPYLWQRVS